MTCHNRKPAAKTQLLFASRTIHYAIYILLALCSLFWVNPPLLATNSIEYSKKTLQIPPELALELGAKIWQNESGGRLSGLITWNNGEDFASLGIGHFIWRPHNKGASSEDEFPRLLKFMQQRGILIPLWLQNNNAINCPWQNRNEFMLARNSPRLLELRHFLTSTIPFQAEYMVYRLETILPKFLASVPPYERPYIYQQFDALLSTPSGLYAMTDYLNFKGSGTAFAEHYDNYGWGLLQVLEYMQFAPMYLTPTKAFVWSAKRILMRHVEQSTPKVREQYEIWLAGWLNRVESYNYI